MHDLLRDFLKDVWGRRLTTSEEIYDLYSTHSPPQAIETHHQQSLKTFYTELQKHVPVAPEIQCDAKDPLRGKLKQYSKSGTITQSGVKPSGPEWFELSCDASTYKRLGAELSGTFFHYRKAGNAGETTRRLYINTKPEERVAVFEELLRRCQPVEGFRNAKVGAPYVITLANGSLSNACSRADGIVIFIQSKEAETAITAEITEYQKSHRDKFLGILPALVKPVDELTGVGYAAEPGVQIILDYSEGVWSSRSGESRPSYGDHMSTIIETCIAKAKPVSADELVGHVDKAMRAAGLDPMRPWESRHTLSQDQATSAPGNEPEAPGS